MINGIFKLKGPIEPGKAQFSCLISDELLAIFNGEAISVNFVLYNICAYDRSLNTMQLNLSRLEQ